MASRLTAHLQNGLRSLAHLEDVEQLSPRVWRILGQNGGAYTLQGTCTYLVGTGRRRLLVDTGDADTSDNYVRVLEQAMQRAGGVDGLEGIVITHWHHDHLGGVRGIQRRFGPGIPVYKYIPAEEEPGFGSGEMAISAYQSWPKQDFVPIADGDVIKTEGATLRALFAPGHANDLCVFTLEEEPTSMFTSDNVLGEGTGVVVSLKEYVSSLKKMRACNPTRLYPGHGHHVEDGSQLIDEYIAHRLKRVNEVSAALQSAKGRLLSLEDITKQVYGDALPQELFGPAMYNVKMALDVLMDENKCLQEPGEDFKWKAKI